jgi:hypothetical protein
MNVRLLLASSLLAGLLLAGCDDNPTTAIVRNQFATTTTVYKLWWVTTLFTTPVAPGDASETERTIPATDYAYALIAPEWPPTQLVAVKSMAKLSATEHQLLTIDVSDDQFGGNCASGSLLSDDDARLITERIFPGDFAGLSYDAATCTSTPRQSDAGTD